MNKLRIEATEETPEILYNAERNTLRIRGSSYPEDTFAFYAPVIEWITKHLEQLEHHKFTLDMDILYINSSSSKAFMNIFRLLDDAAKAGKKVSVNWLYEDEDEDALEDGEGFKMITSFLEFNLVQKEV